MELGLAIVPPADARLIGHDDKHIILSARLAKGSENARQELKIVDLVDISTILVDNAVTIEEEGFALFHKYLITAGTLVGQALCRREWISRKLWRLFKKRFISQVPAQPTQPTIYQIGAVPHAPDLGPIFDRWSRATGLGDAERPILERLDISPKEGWHGVVRFMSDNEPVWGAIIFEQKTRILTEAGEHFFEITPDALATGEINVIVAGPDGLMAANRGIGAANQALARAVGRNYWQRHPDGELVILGGGSRAVCFALAAARLLPGDRPARIVLAEHDDVALAPVRTVLGDHGIELIDLSKAGPAGLPGPAPESIVINAPRPNIMADDPLIGASYSFPRNGVVWDLDLAPGTAFTRYAKEQQADADFSRPPGRLHYDTALELIFSEIFRLSPGAIPEYDGGAENSDT